MHKRLSIRMVDELAKDIRAIAKKRGLSMNSLISEIAWEFVDEWLKAQSAIEKKGWRKTH